MRRWIDHQKIRIEQTTDSVFLAFFNITSKKFPPFGRNFSSQSLIVCVVCLRLCARSAKIFRLFVVLHDFRCPQSQDGYLGNIFKSDSVPYMVLKKTLTPEFSYVSDRVKYLVCAFPIVLESLWAVSERFIHYFSMVWARPKICFDFQISDRRVDGWTQIIPP